MALKKNELAARNLAWLLELTSFVTASGKEDQVIAWVNRYVAKRRTLCCESDAAGNLVIKRRDAHSPKPLYLTAHMDHPAFVVTQVVSANELLAEFRGGVQASYFLNTGVKHYSFSDLVYAQKNSANKGIIPKGSKGKVVDLLDTKARQGLGIVSAGKVARVRFMRKVKAKIGDVLTWDIKKSYVKAGRLYAPVCDDLAAMAGAFAAFDQVYRNKNLDVRLLLTRAEEVGFIGAIGACKAKALPKGAFLVCLENSKSFVESPIGDGPIVRVGDRTSTFDPKLTYQISEIAKNLAAQDATFIYQRRLMIGGTCEASAFQAYGHIATCVCLPLGRYHNMNEATQRIDAESISLQDYHNLIRLLVAVAKSLGERSSLPTLRSKLDELYRSQKHLLNTSACNFL